VPGVPAWRSGLAQQLCEDSPEQIITDEVRIDVLLDGQAVVECQHHGDDIVNGELAQGMSLPEDLFDGVGYRSAQGSPVSDELGAHIVVPDGPPPEVQEDQLPFPLFGERLGEKAPDVVQGLLSVSAG
jgi:hypothetical protein